MRAVLHASLLIACQLIALPPLDALRAQEESPATPGQRLPADRRAGATCIEPARLRRWLTTLTSDEFGGRGTGQEGYRKAADFLAEHFQALELEPAGEDGSWFQQVPWTLERLDVQQSHVRLERAGKEVARLEGVRLHGMLGTGLRVDGQLTVVVTDRHDGSDLTGLELEGAAALVIARRGLLQNPEDPRARRWGSFLTARAASTMARTIRDAGGQLAAIVDDPGFSRIGPFQPRSSPGARAGGPAASARGRTPTVLVLSMEQMEALLAPLNPPSFDAAAAGGAWTPEARLRADVVVNRDQAPATNVCARLKGSDPALARENVVVGCHLDHLGTRGGVLHPGADDDGSGIAGLMAVAEAFASNPIRPRRSLLFVAFCGEENGLIGSAYFAAHPTVPLESMVAELQLDMIGRNEEKAGESPEDNVDCLHLVGSRKLSNDLHELCVELNAERAGFRFEWDEEGVFYRSDHWNFAREGVPIAFFFTGFHPDYHQPSDTADKIDYPKLQRVATYVYDVAFELAQRDQRPRIDPERWEALERKGRTAPVAPLRR